MARQLVELGFRGSGEVLKREDFIARKLAAEVSRLSERHQQNLKIKVAFVETDLLKRKERCENVRILTNGGGRITPWSFTDGANVSGNGQTP
ncbi:UNVERIFIED_CONTAM: hypothetical protein K2H54_019301 [Gekko kuhli]